MNQRVTFNIHGSCVSRDIMEYPWNTQIRINQYVSRNSVFSAIESPLPLVVEELTASHPWEKRMLLCDFNKEVFKYLSNPADFLLIDLIDERYKVFHVSNKTIDTIITASAPLLQNKELLDEKLRKYDRKLIDTALLSPDEIRKVVERYIAKVLECIASERIIIHEAYFTENYKTKDGQVKQFDTKLIETFITPGNTKLAMMYQWLEEGLPGSKVVKATVPVLGDENNKWGVAPMHYTEAYYKDIYNQITQYIES